MSTTSDGRPLWCPNCDVMGRVRLIPQRDRESGTRSCKGTCGACGYSIDQLGSDGTQSKAADEWQAISEHALEVKKQLLGATKMAEKQLELDIPAFIGFTDWIDAGKKPPEYAGWYNVRRKMTEEERVERKPSLERRWWSPRSQSFSWPVQVHEGWEDQAAECAKQRESRIALHDLEYQGLLEPHPELAAGRFHM